MQQSDVKLPVCAWRISKPEVMLSTLKFVAEAGIVIANLWEYNWKEVRTFDVGLVFPPDHAFYRRFNAALREISDKVLNTEYGFIEYHAPIDGLCPGDGGEIALKDCLFVPENWTTGLGAGFFKVLETRTDS